MKQIVAFIILLAIWLITMFIVIKTQKNIQKNCIAEFDKLGETVFIPNGGDIIEGAINAHLMGFGARVYYPIGAKKALKELNFKILSQIKKCDC